ncbi:MAG: hypothetical protein ACK4Z4_06920 [Ferrovibrio sp.]|nr:hypothetical protein [Alphaproteobacteria bacterium]
MKNDLLGYWVIVGLLILLGCVGILVSAKATDTAMEVFGLVLAAFAVFFSYFAIHRTHR